MIMLQTARLMLRDHLMEDLPSHHLLLSNPEVMHYLQDIMTHSPEESEENLRIAVAEAENPARTFCFLRMEERGTLNHVGEIGYTVEARTPVGKLVHLGYFTHKAFWGRGYVTEALRELVRFAFEEDGVYRLTTGCLRGNKGSERVMQKCGLIREAERRDWEWLDGTMHTRVEYRLLEDEYHALKQR